MKKFLTNVVRNLTKPAQRKSPARPHRPTLRVEQLESRALMTLAIAYVPVTADLNTSTGELRIAGNKEANTIRINETVVNSWVSYLVISGVDSATINWTAAGGMVPTQLVRSIRVDTLGGDDMVSINRAATYYDGSRWAANPWYGLGIPTTINTGTESDTVNLSGNNASPSTVFGGAGNDTITGGVGGDFLRGEGGNDVLYGGGGNDELGAFWKNGVWMDDANDDRMFGGWGNDLLAGGTGDDKLLGESGSDWIYGDSGNDMLFGGANDARDNLIGGPGADRFLMPANLYYGKLDPFESREDVARDFAAEDARPTFLNGYAIDLKISDTETWKFTPMYWSDTDILRTDAVLEVLQREGRSTKLLETPSGGDLVIVRHGDTNRGYNDGWIHMTSRDNQYGGSDETLRGYLLHEIGHHWQGTAFQSGGIDRWTQFVSVSLWTSVNPNNLTYFRSENEGRKKADKTPDYRWYKDTTTFASDYAKTNENEDFAESFAAYFTQRAGWTFYLNGAGAAAIPDKMTIFAWWVALL